MFLQIIQKHLRRLGKNLRLFPYQIHSQFLLRFQRPKTQISACGIHQLIQRKGIPHPFIHHQGSVVNQIVGSHRVKLRGLLSKPAVQTALVVRLPGENQRLIPQILRQNLLLLRQRAVLPHQDPPGILHGKFHILVFHFVHIPQQNTKRQQPLVQAIAYIHRIAADNVKQDPRIAFLNLTSHSGNLSHPIGFTGTDIEIPADRLLRLDNLLFRPINQFQDFLCTFSQQRPLLGEDDLSVAANHQLCAKFILQLLQLAGQRWLSQMKRLGRRRNILLSGYRQEVLQHSQFHIIHLHLFSA